MNSKLKLLPVLLAIFFISGCDNPKDTGTNYRIKDGLYYEARTEKLFSGRVIDTTDVIIEFEIVEGKKHGEFTTYFLNGNIEKRGYINDNKNEGEWKYYYQDGKIETIGNYKNDKPNGIWTFYYQNGSKKEEGNYTAGERTGKWLFYNEEGEVVKEHDFDSGELINNQNQRFSTTSPINYLAVPTIV